MKKYIPISEIFYSLQGEGRNLGKFFIFVRFAGCNLQCGWCDTKYASHKDFLKFEKYSFVELVDEISALSEKYACRNILFTGGEPLLQQNVIGRLIQKFSEYFFEVETNGSIALRIAFDQVNVGYKLSNAGVKGYELKIFPGVNIDYKFVICSEKDISEALGACKKYGIPLGNVYFMPEGVDREVLKKRGRWLKKRCKEIGVNFTERMQVIRGIK